MKFGHFQAGMTGLTSFYRPSIHRALFAIPMESVRLGQRARRRSRREAHLSAKQAYPQAPAWISGPPGDGRRPQGLEEPARQRAQAAVGVTPQPVGDGPTVNQDNGSIQMGRLTKRSEFLRVAAGRRRWAAPGLVLEARRTETEDEAFRIGFTVSRKVGGAVERNRARRRLRAIARSVLPSLAKGGFDYVLIGRKATLTRAYDGLIADLEESLRRVKATREDRQM